VHDNSSVVPQLRAESPLGRLGDVSRPEEVRFTAIAADSSTGPAMGPTATRRSHATDVGSPHQDAR
jgi:hypothetical protein